MFNIDNKKILLFLSSLFFIGVFSIGFLLKQDIFLYISKYTFKENPVYILNNLSISSNKKNVKLIYVASPLFRLNINNASSEILLISEFKINQEQIDNATLQLKVLYSGKYPIILGFASYKKIPSKNLYLFKDIVGFSINTSYPPVYILNYTICMNSICILTYNYTKKDNISYIYWFAYIPYTVGTGDSMLKLSFLII